MNNQAKGMSGKASDVILAAILAVVLVIVAYPLYYVVIGAVPVPVSGVGQRSK